MFLACTDHLVGPERWKEKGDLLKDNINLDLQEMEGVGGTDWIVLAQVRNMCLAVENRVFNLRVPENAGYFLAS